MRTHSDKPVITNCPIVWVSEAGVLGYGCGSFSASWQNSPGTEREAPNLPTRSRLLPSEAPTDRVDGAGDHQCNAPQHAQHVQKLVRAFQTLYDAIPDEQKRLADQVFRANAEGQAQTHRAPNG